MKLLFNRTLTLAAELLATLAACIGCGKSDPPKEFHWRGTSTGYEHTTPVPPDNQHSEPEDR
jgi:hypothetical protein